MANEFQKAMGDAMVRQQRAFVEQFSKYPWGDRQQAQAAQPEYEYRIGTYANINLQPSYILPALDAEPRDTIPAPPVEPPQCRECSRPERPIAATHGELCVYCNHSKEGCQHVSRRDADVLTAAAMRNDDAHPGEAAARARLAAADRKAQPRQTAESRMLALPHPWECDDA